MVDIWVCFWDRASTFLESFSLPYPAPQTTGKGEASPLGPSSTPSERSKEYRDTPVCCNGLKRYAPKLYSFDHTHCGLTLWA